MAARDVTTTPDPRGGWINKQDGTQVGVVYDTQEEAAQAGRQLARDSRSEHVVHGIDGTLRVKNTYRMTPHQDRVIES